MYTTRLHVQCNVQYEICVQSFHSVFFCKSSTKLLFFSVILVEGALSITIDFNKGKYYFFKSLKTETNTSSPVILFCISNIFNKSSKRINSKSQAQINIVNWGMLPISIISSQTIKKRLKTKYFYFTLFIQISS